MTAAEAAFDSVADAEDSHRDDFQVLDRPAPLLVARRKCHPAPHTMTTCPDGAFPDHQVVYSTVTR